VLPISRCTLLTGYVITAVALLLVEACTFVTAPLVNFEIPSLRLDYVPYAIFFAMAIAAGLLLGKTQRPRTFPSAGPLVASLTASYSLATVALAVVAAWTDFTARDLALEWLKWDELQDFFTRHPPYELGIGLWVVLTPFALIAFPGTIWLLRWSDYRDGRGSERLAALILCITLGSTAFLLGSMMTETRFSRGEVDIGDVIFAPIPVIILGALTAWVVIKFSARMPSRSAARSPIADGDFTKSLSSASQISVVTLVLLYLGISQTSGYASRIAELIELRHAFAADILHDFFANGGTLNTSTLGPDGQPRDHSGLVPDVPWGDVEIVKYAAERLDHRYSVQVRETLNKETWSVNEYRQTFGGKSTQQVADRQGVRYDAAEGSIKIYPRVEAQIRAKEVAFPGTGLSFELASFTLVVPFVVFAALVLLAYRANVAISSFSSTKEPWILLDASRGLPALLAWLWLCALTLGPWVLGVLVVQVVGLTLRATGPLKSVVLDSVATAYVAVVLTILLTATISAINALLTLRALARAKTSAADW
jgi:hypothetical protein